MPLVRISLREGKNEEYRKAIADGVHRTQTPAKAKTVSADGRNSGGESGIAAAGLNDQSSGGGLGKLVVWQRRSAIYFLAALFQKAYSARLSAATVAGSGRSMGTIS